MFKRILDAYAKYGAAATAKKIIRKPFRVSEELYLRQFGADFLKSRYGVLLKSNWNDETFKRCFFGSYGTSLSAMLENKASDYQFIDIGSNQGLYSLIAAETFNCKKVVALEPVPSTFEILEANVAANNATNKTTCINAALSDEESEKIIYFSTDHSGGASLAGNDHGDLSCTVKTITAEKLIEHIEKNLPAFVKIDVEGHELTVVKELVDSPIIENIQWVYYEVDEDWSDPSELSSLLEGAGFVNFKIYGFGKHYDVLASK